MSTPAPRMKLLPFPWVVATRKLARRMIEHIEGCHRIISRQQAEIAILHSRLDEMERAGKRLPMAMALEQLLSLLTEEQQRGVRLGYVLGHHDAEHGYPEAVPPDSPEHRYLLDMKLIDPDLW